MSDAQSVCYACFRFKAACGQWDFLHASPAHRVASRALSRPQKHAGTRFWAPRNAAAHRVLPPPPPPCRSTTAAKLPSNPNERRQALRQRCYERCMKKYGWHPVCVYSPDFPEPTAHMPEAKVSQRRRAQSGASLGGDSVAGLDGWVTLPLAAATTPSISAVGDAQQVRHALPEQVCQVCGVWQAAGRQGDQGCAVGLLCGRPSMGNRLSCAGDSAKGRCLCCACSWPSCPRSLA